MPKTHKISQRVLDRRRALTAVTNNEDRYDRAVAAIARADLRVTKAEEALEAAKVARLNARAEAEGQKAALEESRAHLIEVTGLQLVPDETELPLPDTI